MAVFNWYVLRTKPRQEQIAEANLERQGFEAWNPQLRCERRQRNRWQSRLEPLFPGYLFVRLAPGVQSFSPIRSTRGVSCLVSFNGCPAPMPEGSVEALRSLHALRAAEQEQSPLQKGTEVRIVSGPFTGWEGVYNARAGDERVIIMLDILGGRQSLVFERDNVVVA